MSAGTITVHGRTWDEVAARHGLTSAVHRVGDGWADLVDRLLTDLEAMGWRPTPITRLEEKYGELRFEAGNPTSAPSYQGWPSEWEARVDEAERESDRTCSRCGRPAEEVVIRGWVHKLCPACAGTVRGDDPSTYEGRRVR